MRPRNTSLAGFLLLGLSTTLVAGSFKDVPRKHWAYKAIQQLQDAGMIQGRGQNFEGQRAFSRYEMAVVLARYMEKLGDAKSSIQKSLDRTFPLIKKLAQEFSAELDLLGVKHQELLARVTSLETRTDMHSRQIEELRALAEENRQLLMQMQGSPLAAQARYSSPERRAAAAEPANLWASAAGGHPSVYRTIAPPTGEAAIFQPPAIDPSPMYPTPRAEFELAQAPRPEPRFMAGPLGAPQDHDTRRLQSLRMRARALLDDNQPRSPRPVQRAARRAPPPPAVPDPVADPGAWTDPAEALVDAMGKVQRGEMDVASATAFGQQVEQELTRPASRRGKSVLYPITERLFGPGGFGPPAGD